MRNILIPLLIAALIVIGIFLVFQNMEQEALDLLERWKEQEGRFALVSAVVLVSDIVLPVPSSMVMYLNGFVLGLTKGAILSFVSLMISTWIGYGLGSLPRFKNQRNTLGSESFMSKYGPYAILLSRGIPILSESVSFVCGYQRMNLRSFTWLNAFGFLPICLLYAYMGQAASEANAFLFALGISIAVTILFWGFGYLLNRKSVTS